MNDQALQSQSDLLTAEGLEDLFVDDATLAQPSRNPCVTLSQGGLTFKAACDYFELKPTALRMRIKSGEIAADKISGANGPEWRIYPDKPAQPLRDPSATVALPLHNPDGNKFLEIIQDLQNKLDNANQQLQAASFRNGYLESQLQERDKEIKLLTDSQHKNWWTRLQSWFTSDR
jgi:hypothetical protein